MSVRQKGKGFEVRVYLGVDPGTGRQKYASKMAKTEREAKRLEAELIRQQETNTYVPPSHMTLREYLAEWLTKDAKPNTKSRTYERYEEVVRVHIAPELGALRPDKLTPHHVATMLARKRESGLSSRTCLHIYRVLHRALEVAVRWGLLGRNVCDAVDPPRTEEPVMHVLDAAQVTALLDTSRDDRLYPLYLTAVMTGMRQGELFGLRWQDIDFDRSTALIQQTLEKPGLEPRFGTPKNRKARLVPVTPAVADALRRLWVNQQVERAFHGTDYCDYDLVFCQDNGRPLDPHSVLRWSFKPLLKKAGLPNIRFHDLRHTFVSRGLQAGANPRAISEIVGHHDPGFTLKRYGHVVDDDIQVTARRLEHYLRQS